QAGAASRLLQVMQQSTRPVQPRRLGVIGEQHLSACLARYYGAHPATVRYKKKMGMDGRVPFVVEVAFGVKAQSHAEEPRDLVVGLNWSPALQQPLPQLDALLGEMRVDRWDPVVVAVHLAHPRLEATDRGKGRYVLAGPVLAALERCVRLAAASWKKVKRRADREGRLAEQGLEEERRRGERGRRLRIKEAAYAVMEQAYLHASDPGSYGSPGGRRLPAEARQVMYAARALVLGLTGDEVWKTS